MTNFLLQQIIDKKQKIKEQNKKVTRTEILPHFRLSNEDYDLPSMKNQNQFNEFMSHIRQLLDRNKQKSNSNLIFQQQTFENNENYQLLSIKQPNNFILNKASKQQSKRPQYEQGFKEFTKTQRYISNQIGSDEQIDSQTKRVKQYQQRIGLVKKDDKTELHLRQIAQKHNIKW